MTKQQIEQVVVSAEQMRRIEERIFAAGMPVAALMERAALLTARQIQELYPREKVQRVGVLVGPGHNGGDALVVARELWLARYQVLVYCPLAKLKELTAQHAGYVQSLGVDFSEQIESVEDCDLVVDGLFGFGNERSISGKLAEDIDRLNQWQKQVVSIDIPSGLHTDTGEVLGTAVQATHSLCLGLWKLAYFQDQALEYIGKAQRIDFGIPWADIVAVVSETPPVRQVTQWVMREFLPLPRPLLTHKYQQGHLLIICGSGRYAGGAILTGLGARASGVGMLSIAVPESLKPLLVSHLPEALIIECPETETGAIATLPTLAADLSKYTVIACGPGLTMDGVEVVKEVLNVPCPLVLDADGLNILAQLGVARLAQRQAPTVLTPHLGEFRRLFPDCIDSTGERLKAVQKAATESGAIVLLKGARTAISVRRAQGANGFAAPKAKAYPDGSLWLIPDSTPALARGGSGDVLTGLIGGLIAQKYPSEENLSGVVASAAWWHAQAGIRAAQERTELGVDPVTLSQYLRICLTQ
jgi:NAD(P)H-hydrate epimerase